MPHLDIFGLSEMFCLTNAGNHHWSLISKITSKTPTEWKNDQGKRIYASFLYTSISYSRNFNVKEDDVIGINCIPLSFRAPFFISETKYINSRSDIVVRVKLMSTFIIKNGESNSQFVRSSIPLNSEPFGESHLESTRRRYKEINNFDDKELKEIAEHKVNPSVDFNAAKFMYFANYCHLFKRYESSEYNSSIPIEFREIAYFANVDPFERITVYARQEDIKVLSAMKRSSDQKCIARSHSVAFQG